MPGYLNRLSIIIDNISNWSGEIAKWIAIPLTILVFGEVLARYLFSAATSWNYELTGYLFGTFSLLGGAYCIRHDVHVRMSIVRDRCSPRVRSVIDLFTSSLMFLFLLLLLYKSGVYALEATLSLETSGTAWDSPIWPYFIVLPVSVLLMLLQAIRNLVADLNTIVSGRDSA